MANANTKVTYRVRQAGELPDDLVSAVLMTRALDGRGLVGEVSTRLWLPRKSGYQGWELFIVILTMWASGRIGQRAVCAVGHPQTGQALAAASGLRSWPSQGAVSRALKSLLQETVRSFLGWLLSEALPCDAFLRDASTFHLDTLGERWRVVDVDGRVEPFRQRGLPEDAASPPPVRLPKTTAKPGYPGRKRSDVQAHEMVVQDAGTGLFLGVRLEPGNGDHCHEVPWAAGLAAQFAARLEHPRHRTVLRLDGKAVGAPTVAATMQAGVGLVTRWSDYALLRTAAGFQTLRTAVWSLVADAGSTPHRLAAEFGSLQLHEVPRVDPSDPTRTQPTEIRLVVTRYPLHGAEARGCGITMGDWRYELLATDLPAAHWPAAELTELYFGRASQENRFSQRDAELGSVPLLSQHLPALELCVGVALFLSNWRTIQGTTAAGWQPALAPTPRPRVVQEEPPGAEFLPTVDASPSGASTEASSSAPPMVVAAAAPGTTHRPTAADRLPTAAATAAATHAPSRDPATAADQLPTAAVTAASLPDPPPTTTSSPPRRDEARSEPTSGAPPEDLAEKSFESNRPRRGRQVSAAAQSTIAALWTYLVVHFRELLVGQSDWTWRCEPAALLCPAGQPAQPFGTYHTTRGVPVLRLRVSNAACRGCERRIACTASDDDKYRREIQLHLPQAADPTTSARPRVPCAEPNGTAARRHQPLLVAEKQRWRAPAACAAGPYLVQGPTLVPASLRRAARDILAACRVEVKVPRRPRRLARVPWLALTPSERQHRRQTFAQRIQVRQCALAPITIAVPPGLRRRVLRALLGHTTTG